MADPAQYAERWGLGEVTKLTETPTSTIYKAEKDNLPVILKIYTDLGRSCEKDGPAFLVATKGYGVVEMLEYDEGACLLKFLEGPELKFLVDENKDEEATTEIGKLLNTLHSAPVPKNHNFHDLEHRFEALFRHAKGDVPQIVKIAAEFARSKLPEQQDIRLLHGDMHHLNVMQHNGEWVMLDPQPLIGDRAYDGANTLHNPHQRPELTENESRLLGQANILGEIMAIDPQRIIDYAFIHGCLSACWSKEDDDEEFEDSLAIKTSVILQPHTSMSEE